MRKGKWIALLLALVILVSLGGVLAISYFPLGIPLNETEFALNSVYNMPIAPFNNSNGSWWGHNQTKIASIGNVTFSFHYNNQNLENGNSSGTNPYECKFVMILNGAEEEIDARPCNRPGNVLADAVNNKVYYILVEPTGQANLSGEDYTWFSRTVMYEYDYSPTTRAATLIEVHEVTPETSDGKIRQGATLDSQGNVAIAYGTYDGMMIVYTFDVANRIWNNYATLGNTDNDSLMYCNVVMKDLEHVYVLAQQDTSNENGTFYLYVKFFALEEGIWTGHMVVDYRNHPLAQTEDSLVLNSGLLLRGNEVHILATAQRFFEVTYLVFHQGEITSQDTSYLPKDIQNIKLMELNGKLYFISVNLLFRFLVPRLSIVNVEEKKTVFVLASVVNYRYFYINKLSENSLQVLIYPSRQKMDGLLYTIHKVT